MPPPPPSSTRSRAATVERLDELAGQCDSGGFVDWWARAARLDADRDGAALDRLAASVCTRGGIGLATDLSVIASHRCAERGEPSVAYRAGLRARRLRSEHPGRRSPLALEPAAVLSDRESEICELAPQVSTNREIADRLFVSERTVEGHLHRSYRKLGLHSRDELVELLADVAPGR